MEFNKWQITCSLIEPTRRSPYYVELQLPVTTERATSHPHSAPPSRRAVAERRTSEAARDVGARSGNERCQFSLASIERNIGAKCKQLGPGSQQLDSLTFFSTTGVISIRVHSRRGWSYHRTFLIGVVEENRFLSIEDKIGSWLKARICLKRCLL